MVVDNFNILEKFMQPETNDEFWFAQIIARRKDIPDLSRSDKLIKTYYLRDFSHLKSKEEEIKKLCKVFHARFYLNPNVRSFERVNAQMGKAAWTNIENKQFDACIGMLESICGGAKYPGKDKIWVIDIDHDTEDKTSVEDTISLINSLRGNPVSILGIFPTLHGFHLLTNPFNVKEFFEKSYNSETIFLSSDDIHKNSPTLIYFDSDTI